MLMDVRELKQIIKMGVEEAAINNISTSYNKNFNQETGLNNCCLHEANTYQFSRLTDTD